LTFVVYTPNAFTPAGQQALASLAAQNGITLDGTPVLKRKSEIDDLVSKEYLQLLSPPRTVHAGAPRYVV